MGINAAETYPVFGRESDLGSNAILNQFKFVICDVFLLPALIEPLEKSQKLQTLSLCHSRQARENSQRIVKSWKVFEPGGLVGIVKYCRTAAKLVIAEIACTVTESVA